MTLLLSEPRLPTPIAPEAQGQELMPQERSPSEATPPRAPAVWPLRETVRQGHPAKPSRRWAAEVMFGMLLVVVVHAFVLQISIVKGHSMEPSLRDGDRLVVDRIGSSIDAIDRGDVVVMRYPRNPAVDFVKRVVGLPGDRVALLRGQLWVNGEMAPDAWTCIADLETTEEIDVPLGCYFVLGDNRPISCDSREFGLVPESLVRGKVRARFWPLDRVAVF
jgi:signal peptidase I